MTRRSALTLAVVVAVVAAGLFPIPEAQGQISPPPPRSNPTEGGPHGSLPTTFCSNLPGSYCYAETAGDPIGTAAGVLSYLDNAARNWGCTWNLSARPPSDLGGGSWSKWYGSESDGSGCGVAYWNHARQAAFFLPGADRGTNVAAASQGATVNVSSTFNARTPASSLIDGNRRGNVWGSGGGWSSLYNPTPASPQWIQVNLNRNRTIREVLVTTLQDNYDAPAEPTVATTFTTYGIRDYSVDYWNGSGWVQLASTAANNRVLRRFTFAPVTTSRLRVNITAALQNYARVVEVEAYEASSSSAKILDRYASLRSHTGELGLPVSNPVPYGWAGATYQQFTNGIITYVSGQPTAFHVGGTAAEDKALATRYAAVFGISPTTGPAIYGLAREVDCTNPAGSGCEGEHTGRYVEWADAYQGFDEMVIARTGWTRAVYVPGGIRSQWYGRYGRDPWNSELGFPLTDLEPTGSATYHQEFEGGSILWEPSGCTTGAYAARIVSQFRRPIARDNLTMLCRADEPANRTRSLPTGAVPFESDGQRGDYRFNSGPAESGWFSGATVRLAGNTFDVNGPFYSAWLGGGTGGAAVAEALAGGAAGWGAPTGNATCVDNPCTTQLQSFDNGLATWNLDGIVGWAPTGVDLPVGFGPYDRGYTTTEPPNPGPQTLITHRSGDFIMLAWLNKATAPDVTTTIYRTMRPLNGTWTSYAVIGTYPPPTLAKGTITEFTDYTPLNNATICYYIEVSDGFNTENTHSAPACTHTLDGTTVAGVDRSRPRGVNRAQLKLTVPSSPDDSATLGPVAARLESFKGGFDWNQTYLDSTAVTPSRDFALGSTRTYDLQLTGIEDVSDIVGITVTSDHRRVHGDIHNDNLRISQVQLFLDNVLVFSKTFNPPQLVSNSGVPGGTSLQIGFEELRSHTRWKDIYATGQFLGFPPAAFASKLDAILSHKVFTTSGAAYHGSQLRDGFATALSKPSGFQRDRLHVRQNVTADSHLGIFCSIDYDLRITAQDANGIPVDPLRNPGGIIRKTQIGVENPNVDCGSTFMRDIIYTIFSTSEFYPGAMEDLSKDMEATLKGQAPSQLQSAPPPNLHFCFPRTDEAALGAQFENGGLSVCNE